MRDYGAVSPQFWLGKTGRSLRGKVTAQLVALYLMTSPHANMIGVFYCPIDSIAKETGLPMEGASEGLRSLIEAGFCRFDEETEEVFVKRMAAFQIGESLDAKDNRCKGIAKELEKVSSDVLRSKFHATYSGAFNLPKLVKKQASAPSPSKAPSEPLRSQEQEQEQEQDKEGAKAPLPSALLPANDGAEKPAEPELPLLIGTAPAIPPCPLQQLVRLFTAKVPELPHPRIELWKDSSGADAMRQRWKWLLSKDAIREDGSPYATNAAEAVDWFSRFFDNVHASDFLTGRVGTGKFDLAWLMKRENFMKVVQGNYVNKERAFA